MKIQNKTNHIRFYYPHHFVFYPVIIALTATSTWLSFEHPDKRIEFLLLAAVFFILGWLSFMLRQHYALNNQNRIVRLEMRLRYYQLTGKKLEDIENQLSFEQLAALRFASDEELEALIQRSLIEDLSPAQIKDAIKDWVPDYMRV